jgi:hypothetical protein
MGNQLTKFINDLDGQEVKKQEAMDALEALKDACDANIKLHYMNVVSDAMDTKILPVHKVINKDYGTYCSYAKNSDKLPKELNSAIGYFVKGDVMEGLKTTITSTLNKLVSNISGSSTEVSSYAITAGPIGGVTRVDYYFYYYKFTSASLSDVSEDVLAYSCIISSVDIKDLTSNDVAVLVQTSYAKNAEESDVDYTKRLNGIRKTILEAMESAAGGDRRILG